MEARLKKYVDKQERSNRVKSTYLENIRRSAFKHNYAHANRQKKNNLDCDLEFRRKLQDFVEKRQKERKRMKKLNYDNRWERIFFARKSAKNDERVERNKILVRSATEKQLTDFQSRIQQQDTQLERFKASNKFDNRVKREENLLRV